MRAIKVLSVALLGATPAIAQETPNTILVMDGSGSMWGQIDGKTKIETAQEVVGNLVGTIPSDQGLGLTVYGHRSRGDCTDIETVVAPAPGTANMIRSAVSGIKPLGKTPMTDAVIAAAEELRYTEDKATVILVSDGVETCNPDPCAAARLLEEAGIDFTAHVIGFDVGSDPAALAQMRCLAEQTGGQFLTADNADQLQEALTTVAAQPEPVPEPEPVIAQVTFEARLDKDSGPLVEGPVTWTLSPEAEVAQQEQGNGATADLEAGSYEVTAYWLAQEVEAQRQFVTTETPRTVVVVFDSPPITATVIAPDAAPVGSSIEVTWNGPDNQGDIIGLTPADNEDLSFPYRFSTRQTVDDGKPASLLMPTKPGNYVVEYALGKTSQRIGATPIMLTPVEATITAPDQVNVGSEFEVSWTGPAYEGDFLAMTLADYKDPAHPYRFASKSYLVADGSIVRMTAPAAPGAYIIEYAFGQDSAGLVSVPIEVTPVSASITAPASAPAGAVIEVSWQGPGYDDDYVGVTAADYENHSFPYRFATHKVPVTDGETLRVQLPSEPGAYVVEYVIGQDDSRLVSAPIEVMPVSASITAPSSAPAGSIVEVSWQGPGYKDDYVGVTAADNEDHSFAYRFATNKVPVADGETLRVQLPTEPGAYVVEYVIGQDDSRLVSAPIEVMPVSASITAPSSAPAGSIVEVSWQGPGYDRDYVGITAADNEDHSFAYRFATNKVPVADGETLRVQLPTEPGAYVVEYALGLDNERLATAPIEVTPVSVTLTAPAQGAAGETIEVAWSGPGYPRDSIGITPADYEDENYAYRFTVRPVPVADGEVIKIALPEEPGDYVIEYVSGLDNSRYAAIPVSVK